MTNDYLYYDNYYHCRGAGGKGAGRVAEVYGSRPSSFTNRIVIFASGGFWLEGSLELGFRVSGFSKLVHTF